MEPQIVTLQEWGSMQVAGDAEQYVAQWEELGRTVEIRPILRTDQPPKLQKNPLLIKEMEMDITDLLLYLFKDQPRISSAQHFSSERYREGTRHYERDLSIFQGTYSIRYKRTGIAIVTRKPHKKVQLIKVGNKAGRTHFAQQLLVKVVNDLFPAVKVAR